MKVFDCAQGSLEWHEVRRGVPTASNFDKIITTQGKPSTQAKKYMYQLAGEAVSGQVFPTYQSAAMQWGIDTEAEARLMYEMVRGVEVRQVGFMLADEGYGASPDGLVGDDGLVQIKCPNMATHVGYLIENKLPTDYIQQVQGELLVAERKWCDFVSYYPGLKPLIVRISKDIAFTNTMYCILRGFIVKLDETIKLIT